MFWFLSYLFLTLFLYCFAFHLLFYDQGPCPAGKEFILPESHHFRYSANVPNFLLLIQSLLWVANSALVIKSMNWEPRGKKDNGTLNWSPRYEAHLIILQPIKTATRLCFSRGKQPHEMPILYITCRHS